MKGIKRKLGFTLFGIGGSKNIRILNKVIDIDIKMWGYSNKWFEIRICGVGIDLNYDGEPKRWHRNSFARCWFKMWRRNRKSDFLHWKGTICKNIKENL